MGYFALCLARLVGKDGKVFAADLQKQMLVGLQKRAEKVVLFDRIQLCQSTPDQIGIDEPVDFVLAFWMVHEVKQAGPFLHQIYNLLVPGGNFLMVEPLIHVSGSAFEKTVSLAEAVGFQIVAQPKVRISRAVLFGK